MITLLYSCKQCLQGNALGISIHSLTGVRRDRGVPSNWRELLSVTCKTFISVIINFGTILSFTIIIDKIEMIIITIHFDLKKIHISTSNIFLLSSIFHVRYFKQEVFYIKDTASIIFTLFFMNERIDKCKKRFCFLFRR